VKRRAAVAALLAALASAGAAAQEIHLFRASAAGSWSETSSAPWGATALPLFDLERSHPWGGGDGTHGERAFEEPGDAAPSPESMPVSPPLRRCVLLQCVTLPVAPAETAGKIFRLPVTLWTATGLLAGVAIGIQGPLNDGYHSFRFVDEGFFSTATYGGGADKCSHFIVSAGEASLLYDAYALNSLTPDQSFTLTVATTLLTGVLVEVGDGLTTYGASGQDLAADAVGTLSEALVKRNHLDDLISFRLGKVPTTIPPAVIGDRVFSGINYSGEIYTADMKFAGLCERLHTRPGIGRFFLSSVVFMTKGYGYFPALPERYQEVGFEVGLNFPEILKAVGVSDTTWWGDTLLRAFDFFRVPFTQIGVYYNLANQKWYGPAAPYHFY
jgi:hypothetical protein